jgi:hypothetical protein
MPSDERTVDTDRCMHLYVHCLFSTIKWANGTRQAERYFHTCNSFIFPLPHINSLKTIFNLNYVGRSSSYCENTLRLGYKNQSANDV